MFVYRPTRGVMPPLVVRPSGPPKEYLGGGSKKNRQRRKSRHRACLFLISAFFLLDPPNPSVLLLWPPELSPAQVGIPHVWASVLERTPPVRPLPSQVRAPGFPPGRPPRPRAVPPFRGGLSAGSVNSMRGSLFGGQTRFRALRVPGVLPALLPALVGRLASFGGVTGLRPGNGPARAPVGNCAQPGPASHDKMLCRVKGPPACRCSAPLTRNDEEKIGIWSKRYRRSPAFRPCLSQKGPEKA